MPRVVRQTLVEDKNGTRFLVVEREYSAAPVSGRKRTLIRYEFETGEPGDFIDADTFELASTGERFSRVRRVNKGTRQGSRS